MELRDAFACSLRSLRKARDMSQEDFQEVSGRTYISMLERAVRSPTLDKIDELASVLQVHPLTLLALTFMYRENKRSPEKLLDRVASEFHSVRGRLNGER